jgi:hypothetical protein
MLTFGFQMYLLFIYFLNLFLKPNRLRSPSRGQHADDAESIHFDQSKSFLLCTPSLQPHRASQIKSGCSQHPFTLQRAARGSAWPIPLDTNKVCIFNYLVPMYIIYYLLKGLWKLYTSSRSDTVWCADLRRVVRRQSIRHSLGRRLFL